MRASDAVPSGEDLDWFLFRSFPNCEVSPSCFRELLPAYVPAIERGVRFDFELLYVRAIELRDDSCRAACVAIAHAVAKRTLDAGFDAADTIAALRYCSRSLPDPGTFWNEWTKRPALARRRFEVTLDFVLDERELDDFWTLGYLPYVAPDAEVRRRIGDFFSEEACRARLERGWDGWVDHAEGAFLVGVVTARIPGFARASRAET